MSHSLGFSSFDSLSIPDEREAYLLEVWLNSRLFFLRMTHPVDDGVAMGEFETGVGLKRDHWQ